jgi:3-hydroxyisobutyrate dehydrogenase
MTDMTVGIVGMGNIGAPIAARLAEAFTIYGVDADPGRPAPEGVMPMSSIAELATKADIICLCLPSTQAVLAATTSVISVPADKRRVRLIIELSTIGVKTAQSEASMCREAGLQFVDAPVSGAAIRARKGTLAIMCAGDPAAVAAADQVFRQMAAKVFVMGDKPGLGQAMKLANNVISAAALAITSEALIFGSKLGLSPEQMIDVINVSTGRTEVSELKFTQAILPRNYRGAYARVMGKDVDLLLKGVSDAELDLPMARQTGAIWDAFVKDAPMTDFQMIYEYLRDKALPQS